MAHRSGGRPEKRGAGGSWRCQTAAVPAGRITPVLLVAGALLGAACRTSRPPPAQTSTTVPAAKAGLVRFALWGDTPYSEAETTALPRLIDEINAAGVDFSIMIGDIAGGGQCGDAVYAGAAATFDRFTSPLVYLPGDNEWTDCHRSGADPLERLAYLRQAMFPTTASFGATPLELTQQRPDYPEHGRWARQGVVFVSLNVPGSNNNHSPPGRVAAAGRDPAARAAAEAEYQARDAAVRDWLGQAFATARTAGAPGLVVALQADPGFETPAPERAARGVDGYDRFLAALATEATAFAKPVVVVHGDSHRYRFDQPLVDPATGQRVANVWRVETYGSPVTGWVRVTIDPAATGGAFVRVQPEFVAGPRG